jgi:hypothetical protein
MPVRATLPDRTSVEPLRASLCTRRWPRKAGWWGIAQRLRKGSQRLELGLVSRVCLQALHLPGILNQVVHLFLAGHVPYVHPPSGDLGCAIGSNPAERRWRRRARRVDRSFGQVFERKGSAPRRCLVRQQRQPRLPIERRVHAKGRSDNFASVASNIVLLATLAATVGGWIGFVYSRHSRSDRGFILLTAWGLSVALGTFAPLAVQPAVALPTP